MEQEASQEHASDVRLIIALQQVKKTASSSSVTAAAPVRLCKLVRRPDFDGYGFGILVDEKSKLATVTTVEKGGPAEAGGLHAKDCILQVNGGERDRLSQRDVVDRIKSSTKEVRLLVTNKETVATPPSPMRSRRGSLIIPIEEPSGSDNSDEFILYGKEAKSYKGA
nr:Na(+)/H(+) exchange regulatory cofactor NHE-RF1-like [Rhipicephalus microplus]